MSNVKPICSGTLNWSRKAQELVAVVVIGLGILGCLCLVWGFVYLGQFPIWVCFFFLLLYFVVEEDVKLLLLLLLLCGLILLEEEMKVGSFNYENTL